MCSSCRSSTRSNSGESLTIPIVLVTVQNPAEMVELVDTQVSGTCGGNPVEVRVLFSAWLLLYTQGTVVPRLVRGIQKESAPRLDPADKPRDDGESTSP